MKHTLILALLGGTLCAATTSCVTVISPRDSTRSAIVESFYRVHLYAKAHGKVPESITDLPKRDGYANQTQDGWGHELIYNVSDKGTVTLTSFGADQKPGGTDDDADISTTYRWLNEEGQFMAADDLWIVNGEISSED